MPFLHPTNSVKALKTDQSTEGKQSTEGMPNVNVMFKKYKFTWAISMYFVCGRGAADMAVATTLLNDVTRSRLSRPLSRHLIIF